MKNNTYYDKAGRTPGRGTQRMVIRSDTPRRRESREDDGYGMDGESYNKEYDSEFSKVGDNISDGESDGDYDLDDDPDKRLEKETKKAEAAYVSKPPGKDGSVFDYEMAVAGLFEDNDEFAGDAPGKNPADNAQVSKPPVAAKLEEGAKQDYPAEKTTETGKISPIREFKVREFYSEEDDPSAEDELREGTGSVRKAVHVNAYEPGTQDYQDYIHITSRQLAEERKKKERDGLLNNYETGHVRDASRNPALRKEREKGREKDLGYDTMEKDAVYDTDRSKPLTASRPRARERAGDIEKGRSPVRPDGSYREAGKSPASGLKPAAPARASAGEYEEKASSPAGKYPQGTGRVSSATGKLPVKGNVPRRNEFFETESVSSARGRGESDIIQLSDFRIMIIIVSIVVLAIFIFLIFRTNSLSNQLATQKVHYEGLLTESNDDYEILRQVSDSRERRIADLEYELSSYKELNASGSETPGGSNPININDPNSSNPGGIQNPIPTLPPTQQQGYTDYTVASGDTLTRIAKRFYDDESKWKDIRDYNGLPNEKISVGQKLKIPN